MRPARAHARIAARPLRRACDAKLRHERSDGASLVVAPHHTHLCVRRGECAPPERERQRARARFCSEQSAVQPAAGAASAARRSTQGHEHVGEQGRSAGATSAATAAPFRAHSPAPPGQLSPRHAVSAGHATPSARGCERRTLYRRHSRSGARRSTPGERRGREARLCPSSGATAGATHTGYATRNSRGA